MNKFTDTDWFKWVEKETELTQVKGTYRNFKLIFNYLEKLEKEFYYIVETGCIRWDQNWQGEGQFTIIADKFVEYYDGIVLSVNNNLQQVESARNILSSKSIIEHNDSVVFLHNLKNIDDIDVFYLDSFDLDWDNPLPSAEHHLNEFKTIIRRRNKNSFLLCVDDCNIPHLNKTIGKGSLIQEVIQTKFPSSVFYNDYHFICEVNELMLNFLKDFFQQ